LSLQSRIELPIQNVAITPRPYQDRADRAIDVEFETKRSTLTVHPTGSGKTILFCRQAVKRGGCLVIAHRDTLIRQAAAKLKWATGGREVQIEKAQERAEAGDYIVASVQTLKGARLKRFASDFPGIPLIIIDEAHRATAKSYRDILACWPSAKVLGVTATADRTDKVGLDNVFESVADRYEILDATADGWLAPLRWVPVHTEIDLSGVNVTGTGANRDFDQADLDNEIVKYAGECVRAVLDALEKYGQPDMRLAVFTPGVKTAHAACDAMNEKRPGSAAVVDGEMEDEFKRKVLERHQNGELQFVFNCNVMTEGYDDPTLIGIFDCSPTKSRLRAVQRWGRVTRPWPGLVDQYGTDTERRAAISTSPKPWGVVFDLALNSHIHDVCGPLDLLSGLPLSEAVKKEARKVLTERGGTPQDAVAEAEQRLKEQERRARAAKFLAAATKVMVGEPRSVFERMARGRIERPNPENAMTKGQILHMNLNQIPIPPGCTRRIATRMIVEEKKRKASGLCSLAAVEWLRKWAGVDGWKMRSEISTDIRKATIRKGAKLTPEELAPLLEWEPGAGG
jgi:superfamily II DNA or RNA helicase